ncbi:hypothetical protein CO701_22895 [Citrobacter werkmanii]|nr:hypothetical protein CO701_22895 [Citrobacter werkmanii]
MFRKYPATLRAFIVSFAKYVIYSAPNTQANKGREKYKKTTIPTLLKKCDFDPTRYYFIVNNQR